MNLKRGRVLRGYKSIVCGALALGLAALLHAETAVAGRAP